MNDINFKKALGLRIGYLRKIKNLSQEDLAESINKSKNTISNIERGCNSAKLDTYEDIAKALNVSVYELFQINNSGHDNNHRKKISNIISILEDLDEETLSAIYKQINFIIKIKG